MMRLVCPNCEAKYEVPEDAIPETGRDVQCANCGHAWYQMRPRASVAEAAETSAPVASAAPVIDAPVAAATPAPIAAGYAEQDVAGGGPADLELAAEMGVPQPAAIDAGEQALREIAAEADAVVEAATPAAEIDDDIAAAAVEVDDAVFTSEAEEMDVSVAETAAPVAEAVVADAIARTEETLDDVALPGPGDAAAPVAAYAVDESVLAILREEADREAQARRAETAKPLETQTELGIEAAIPVTKRPIEVLSREPDPEIDDKLSARRTRLPDVEEINSTLRPSDVQQDGMGAAEGAASAAGEGRSSFRSGFLLVLTVAILGSALYSSADAIAAAIPALADPLKAYVGFVDGLRLHLDGLMQSATVAINGT